ncbi:transposase [Streptomyces chartreusis]|uniref:transposase n=1 Tax=Streptomyces chartreusis TaxID=1969 RepID=UPI002F911F5F
MSLLAEHQRGHGSLYGTLNHGCLDVEPLRDLLISLPPPRFDGWIVLSVDASPWLRSDACARTACCGCRNHCASTIRRAAGRPSTATS